MKLRYLGTAAAEGFPGIFCTCECCQRAKEDWCAVFYLIEHGESKLLYGHDTGYFPESVWDYLENKQPLLTMVSLDFTGGELRHFYL